MALAGGGAAAGGAVAAPHDASRRSSLAATGAPVGAASIATVTWDAAYVIAIGAVARDAAAVWCASLPAGASACVERIVLVDAATCLPLTTSARTLALLVFGVASCNTAAGVDTAADDGGVAATGMTGGRLPAVSTTCDPATGAACAAAGTLVAGVLVVVLTVRRSAYVCSTLASVMKPWLGLDEMRS